VQAALAIGPEAREGVLALRDLLRGDARRGPRLARAAAPAVRDRELHASHDHVRRAPRSRPRGHHGDELEALRGVEAAHEGQPLHAPPPQGLDEVLLVDPRAAQGAIVGDEVVAHDEEGDRLAAGQGHGEVVEDGLHGLADARMRARIEGADVDGGGDVDDQALEGLTVAVGHIGRHQASPSRSTGGCSRSRRSQRRRISGSRARRPRST
jgi:hypothetical protein